MAGVISELLEMMRVRGTAYVGKNLKSPWNILIEEQEDLARFHIVLAGSTWIGTPGTPDAVKLNEGDLAIVPHGKAHVYYDQYGGDAPASKFLPDFDNGPYFEQLDQQGTDTNLLCGYFQMSRNTPPAITACMPDLIIERGSTDEKGRKFDLVVQLLALELAKDTAPSPVILNRLTEILCLHTIHSWLERSMTADEHLRALADPKTKLVLDAVHSDPTAPWNVENLARLYGQSRTAFAAHFKRATGAAPMNYVRSWRIRLACNMLENSNLSIDEIAFKSGYADTNAFSRAFKRQTGSSPGSFKRMSRS